LNHDSKDDEQITTALLLAAGTGSRLYPLTKNAPKCLTIVNGKSILERMVSNLKQNGFKRLVVVTGHLENHIRDFLGNQAGDMKIEYVFSPRYNTTNNIYSLWMARDLISEPFLLLESDLVFVDSLLNDMLYPDRMAVARMQPWMNGTSVTVNGSGQVKEFLPNKADSHGEVKHKTVNIYSISLKSWNEMAIRLDKRITAGKVNDYYETVFAEMIADGSLCFKTVSFDGKPWYEIDTIEDLAKAEKLFSSNNSKTRSTVPLSKPGFLDEPLINTTLSPLKAAGVLSVAK